MIRHASEWTSFCNIPELTFDILLGLDSEPDIKSIKFPTDFPVLRDPNPASGRFLFSATLKASILYKKWAPLIFPIGFNFA